MSQKIRIGNDIDITWSLKDANEQPYIVEGKNVEIELNVGTKRVKIKEFELSGNQIHFVYYGKDQKHTGSYALKYIENSDDPNMVTFDTKDAFYMVEHSWLAVDEGETPETIQIEVVTIGSVLLEKMGPRGYSAYEIAVQNGFVGTVEEWLESLKGEDGDSAGFGVVDAEADNNVGTPSVEVQTSGPDTAKNLHFVFRNIKGERGSDASVTRTNIEAALNSTEGKNLSTEDYTTAEKSKLAEVESGAEVNVLEGVQVNGTDLEVSGKKVNVPVPTALSQLSGDSTHRVVTDAEKTAWGAKYDKPASGIPASDIASGVIPDVSNFITKSVDDLTNYYLKSETYTKAEVEALIGAINQFHYEIYASTSEVTNPQSNVLYLIGPTGSGADKYEEYVYSNSTWVKIGDTSIDLSGYVTTQALNTALANYTTTADLTTLLAGKQDTISDLSTIRSGASAGATAYQKPSGGIPASDMASGVQTSLRNADSAYQKPSGGIPSTDLTSGVQTSLGKADAALPAADVVDNLTTNDATKALSAKQGKVLDEKVNQKGQKVNTFQSTPDNDHYPSEKLVYDSLALKEDVSNKVTSLSAQSTDNQYPSAKCVYDALYENAIISLTVNSAGTASDLIGLKVTVTNTDTSEQISEQTWQGTPLVVRIKAGVRYTVSVQTHLDYVTPASQTFTSELASTRSVGFIYVYSAVIDLSYRDTDGTKKMVQDTANSYVARVAGDYKLPAVYGNAIQNGATNSAAYTRQGSTYTADFVNYKGVQIASPYIETDTGETIASAVLLWQTGANLISNVAFANGYVTFTVNSIPTENGLAVLAVKDENGDIMWSWTIWLTTDTLTAEKFTNYTEVDYYLMPENLFCIWNEQRTNCGTGMIQWGRKDVMVPNTPGGSPQTTVYDIDGNTITPGTALGSVIGVFGTDNDQSADKTVANSIKNPGMFFTRYDSTNNNWNNLAWFNNFWNAAETSSASSADNQDTAIKTIYDPCPFGWMLPAGRAFTGFTTTGGSTSTASQFNVVGSWSNGWNFKRNSEDTTGNKFIASGYRASGSGAFTNVGSCGHYWSFAPHSQAYARYLYFYSGYVGPQNYGNRSYGFAVRPSRE